MHSPQDADRIHRVRDILDALGANREIDVRLTTRHTRARRRGLLGAGTIWIARQDADDPDPDPDRLRGLVAHEYVHVIDARERRDRAVTSGAVTFLTLVVIAMLMLSRPGAITASGGAPGVAVVVGGCWVLATALMACVAQRAEYRADAHAAQLLGSPRPVVAMLQNSGPDATTRAGALVHMWARALTHPSAQRRIARLEGPHGGDETLRSPTSAWGRCACPPQAARRGPRAGGRSRRPPPQANGRRRG